MSPAHNRMLTILRLDIAALLRGYFPVEVARALSEECEALVRKRVEAGEPMRRVALTPSAYSRPKPEPKR